MMKFDVLIHGLSDVMECLNDKGVRFKDVFFYLKFNGRLYDAKIIDLRYCEEIDKYALVITLIDD